MSDQLNFEIDICRKFFDEDCYKSELEKNKIDCNEISDLCRHFSSYGWKLNLDPCRWFSVKFYVNKYQDVKDANINPFYHYLVAGKPENRLPNELIDKHHSIIQILKNQNSPEEDYKGWNKDIRILNPLNYDEFNRFFSSSNFLLGNDLVVSFSHDNYLNSPGGVQLCISRECSDFNKQKINYLHLFPSQPWPSLSNRKSALFYVGVSVNKKFIGHVTLNTIFRTVRDKFDISMIVFHSLIGFNLKLLLLDLKSLKSKKNILWAHDYFPFCSSFHLMRNSISSCEGPPVNSQMCKLCYYGADRTSFTSDFRNFFNLIEFDIACPSDDVKNRYERLINQSGYKPHKLQTLKHIEIGNLKKIKKHIVKPIKIAYLGYPVFHKGWNEFVKLFNDERLQGFVNFYHLSSSPSPLGHGINYIYVDSTNKDKTSMSDAIRDNNIDFVFSWSLCNETFGITPFESFLGGARIIGHEKSWNLNELFKLTDLVSLFEDVDVVSKWIISLFEAKEIELEFPSEIALKHSLLSLNFT